MFYTAPFVLYCRPVGASIVSFVCFVVLCLLFPFCLLDRSRSCYFIGVVVGDGDAVAVVLLRLLLLCSFMMYLLPCLLVRSLLSHHFSFFELNSWGADTSAVDDRGRIPKRLASKKEISNLLAAKETESKVREICTFVVCNCCTSLYYCNTENIRDATYRNEVYRPMPQTDFFLGDISSHDPQRVAWCSHEGVGR